MTDLQRRRIKYLRDFLAISANCCAYAKRLDEQALDKQDHISLGLALFVQALLNGEILDNRSSGRRPFQGTFAGFFRQEIFKDVQPPVGMERLTFFKHCRFVDAQLCDKGVKTVGYIWEVAGTLNVLPSHSTRPSDLWACLGRLARQLELLEPLVADRLKRFITQKEGSRMTSAQEEYMTAMAKEVAQAWAKGHTLIIAKLQDPRFGCGIFVPTDAHDLSHHLFTVWHNAQDAPRREYQEPINKHVSLELDPESQFFSNSLPLLKIKRWINGICFFNRSAAQEVIFPWPEYYSVDWERQGNHT